MTYTSESQYSLEEYPTNILSHEPLVKRANLRPNMWGSIQRQQTTNPKEKASNTAIFYVALGILALVIIFKSF